MFLLFYSYFYEFFAKIQYGLEEKICTSKRWIAPKRNIDIERTFTWAAWTPTKLSEWLLREQKLANGFKSEICFWTPLRIPDIVIDYHTFVLIIAISWLASLLYASNFSIAREIQTAILSSTNFRKVIPWIVINNFLDLMPFSCKQWHLLRNVGNYSPIQSPSILRFYKKIYYSCFFYFNEN